MRTLRLILGLVALGVSAVPLVWMAILAVAQFGNLWMHPPYVREFPAIAAFWIGFAASIVFFWLCLTKGLKRALSPYVLLPICVGIIGGIAEEVMLLDNAKVSFPIGFFEIAPLSWMIAGVIATKLPNPSLIRTANGERPVS